jgi:hypothetical protein
MSRHHKHLPPSPESEKDLVVGDRIIFEPTGEMGTVEQVLPKGYYFIRLLSGKVVRTHKSFAHFLPTQEQIRARAKALKEMRWIGFCA